MWEADFINPLFMDELENTESTDKGKTEAEFVPLDEVTDQDLEKLLKDADEDETSEGEEENVATKEAQPEVEEQEEEKTPTEEAKGSPSQEENPTDVSREEFEKQQRQLQGLELVVQRRTSDLSNLKRQLVEVQDKLKKALKDKFEEDPAEALEIRDKIKENEGHLKAIDEEQELLQKTVKTQQTVSRYVKPNEVDVEDVARSLLDDGIDPAYVKDFLNNPYATASADTIIHLTKRAKAEKAIRKLLPLTRKLFEEYKKSKNGGKEVLDKIEKAARQTPYMSSSQGGSTAKAKHSNVSPENMSDAEIEEFLKSV